MKNIEYKTIQFVKEIKKTNEYNQYQRLKSKLIKDIELYNRVNEFRKRSFEIQVSSDGEPYEDILKLQYEFEAVLNHPIVSEFIIVEQRLCKMVKNIHSAIIESLNMDVDFLEN